MAGEGKVVGFTLDGVWEKQQQHSEGVQEELLLADFRTFQLKRALGKL